MYALPPLVRSNQAFLPRVCARHSWVVLATCIELWCAEQLNDANDDATIDLSDDDEEEDVPLLDESA